MPWPTVLHSDAEQELTHTPTREATAILNAIEKLKEIGPTLGYPHTSDVRGAGNLRELRPRQGRSPWRAFYRQIGTHLVIAAIGPEAETNPRGFKKAIKLAEQRLNDLEDD